MEDSVLAVVANYDFSDQADDLKRRFAAHFPTVLIDSGSPTPPRTADRILPNGFYTGLWNAAVGLARERGTPWLLFVASDVDVPDVAGVAAALRDVLRDRSVGIWTPSLRADSRLAHPACFARGTGGMRECLICEFFFFLARTDLLARLHPVDPAVNRYGWGIELLAAHHAYKAGRRVLVDDRVTIHHPASIHPISVEEADRQQLLHVPKETWKFFHRIRRRPTEEGRSFEFARRWVEGLRRLARRTYDDLTHRAA